MVLKKYHFAFIGYLFLLPAFAFLIDGTTTAEVSRNGKTVITTPLEESEWRGTHEPYAQNVGRLWQVTTENVSFGNTATLIAPDLILTSGHSATTDQLSDFDHFCFNITINGVTYARHIKDKYICPQSILADGTVNSAKDLAILKLTREIPQSTFLRFYDQSAQTLFKSSPLFHDCLSISTGKLVTNGAVEQSHLCRHVSEPRVTWDSKVSCFTEDHYIPMDYKPTALEPGNVLKLPIFDYAYPNSPFLQGVFVSGDSGGPLISHVENRYQVIGVISTRLIRSAYNSQTSQFVPGGQLFNVWTPTVSNLSWIKQVLSQENALSYHPNLIGNG